MSRLRSFLPQMAAANEVLEREAAEDSSKFDIENVGEDEEKVIEMVGTCPFAFSFSFSFFVHAWVGDQSSDPCFGASVFRLLLVALLTADLPEQNIGLGVFEVKNDQFDVESDVVIHPAPGNSRPKLPDDAIVELNLARAPGSPRAADPPRATDPPRAADPPRANDPPKAADQ
ncbi:MAG: hypothetical protein BJ554DRAFT_1058 [Olpidium bornovanus]|uniref:Uncharacterized protein n=1 Tax=Olpidium bornovanus TaxID=278681 RepID=A0A8H7ZT13_9FUNG|nr:MAG: hypothetical protein BJ554DRAFT_1058 [Olpidium bornovanus]